MFVALGGTSAWAADRITSKDIAKNAVLSKHIKNGQVKSADVKDNGLTGTDINEGSLGQVPSAQSAGSAASATNADHAGAADSATTAGSATSAQTAATAQIAQSVADNAIGSAQVADNSLTGADINESSLAGVGGLLTGRIKTATSNATTFGAPSGESTANVSRGAVQMSEPQGTSFIAHGLRLSLTSGIPLAVGQSIKATVFEGAGATALTCTASGGFIGCNDTQHAVSLSSSSPLSVEVVSAGGAPTQDVTFGFAVQGG
jgi:hypothetical protein